jgi:hypothetical protein
MQNNNELSARGIKAEFDYVTEVQTYHNFDSTTASVTVEEGQHGTGTMIAEMRERGFEVQNVDMEHNRFKFRAA